MPVRRLVIGDAAVDVDEDRFISIDSLRRSTGLVMGAEGRDAQEAMSFLVSQLAYTENNVFERQYQPMQYEQLIPITNEAGEWADSIRYEIYDFAGRGKRHSGKGRDIPMVDIAMADKSFPVVNGAIGYEYSMEELRRSAYLRRPVNERKMTAAVEGYRRHMNEVGLYGDTTANVTGLFNNSFVPQMNAPVGAWLTGPKTAAQISSDLNTAIQTIWTNTAFNDQVTNILLPPTRFAYIASTPHTDVSDRTILQWLLETNIAMIDRGQRLIIQPGFGLDTAGAGGVTRLVAYVKSELRLIMHIPLPLRFLAPQPRGLEVQVPGEYKYSGVEFRYPKSALYMDGI